MTPLVRLATCDAVLVRRAKYGDRRAARRLASRHLDRITLLAAVMGSSSEESIRLARKGFAAALRGARPFEDALVTAFGVLAHELPDADQARARLATLLVEVEQRPRHEVARLLGLTPEGLTTLLPIGLLPTAGLPTARAATGWARALRTCRGWALASRRPGLTEAETRAGAGHLALCRRCRDRLAAVERTRAQLLGGSAGVVGAVAAAQLVPWGGAAATGAGALLTGKAGVVGLLGATVLATGGGVVLADRNQSHRPPTRPASGTPSEPATPGAPARGTAPGATPTSLPSTAPTVAPRAGLPVPLPSGVDRSSSTDGPALPLPSIPLPTLPPLPGLLPLPLPTALG